MEGSRLIRLFSMFIVVGVLWYIFLPVVIHILLPIILIALFLVIGGLIYIRYKAKSINITQENIFEEYNQQENYNPYANRSSDIIDVEYTEHKE